MYLSLGTLVGYMHENKLIATGGVFPFKDRFSTIGMLIVHPHFQRRGIGRILLNHCLEHTHPKQPIALIATKSWRASVYIMRISNSNDDSSF